VNYTYDALDRVRTLRYLDGGGTVNVTFTYDTGAYALGMLSSISESNGITTSWTYNSQGRVASKTQSVGANNATVGYGYDSFARPQQITYPSGQIVTYGYDNSGRINSVQLNGQPLLSNIQYQPFGPAKSWSWGNGTVYSRHFTQDGQLDTYPLGSDLRSLSFDGASRIFGANDSRGWQIFFHDNQDGLTNWITPNTYKGYGYDANGNRTIYSASGSQYGYTYPAGSNRLQSVAGPVAKSYQYDNAGNLIADGSFTYTYDGRGRLRFALGSTFLVNGINALGQQVMKWGGSTASVIRFAYDCSKGSHLVM
jgi:YD repeat-containing protein